jgi:hypothetical protein
MRICATCRGKFVIKYIAKQKFCYISKIKKATRRNGWPLTIACHMKKEIIQFVF